MRSGWWFGVWWFGAWRSGARSRSRSLRDLRFPFDDRAPDLHAPNRVT
ncbi:hypothetical protein I598_3150 [Isoptericola dokdonensis DS-3]|uniref:Uncharacterized protein n=1 Tax=Isoptericola dokdonensis DS-3 TaxID=1300344 RepID=A0A161IKF8_9MICO|nr:hypothetical protein I598_3150 [Isoptericola dokdonensis DS-3]